MEMKAKVETAQVEIRREEFFACGCTTTRIESSLSMPTGLRKCKGHGGPLMKVVATTEYKQTEINAGER